MDGDHLQVADHGYLLRYKVILLCFFHHGDLGYNQEKEQLPFEFDNFIRRITWTIFL